VGLGLGPRGLCYGLQVQLHDRGLSEVLYNPNMGHERLDESRDRLAPLIDAMAERAKHGGRLRPDFEGTDIVFIQVALTGLMNRTRRFAPDLYRRYLTIVLDGMRTDQGRLSKLLLPALTVKETHEIITLQTASPRHLTSRRPTGPSRPPGHRSHPTARAPRREP